MKTTDKQKKLLNKIESLGRLLTEEEVIDFYIENNCKGTCHTIVTVSGLRTFEDSLWQIRDKARNCYTYALGRLVVSGHFRFPEKIKGKR